MKIKIKKLNDNATTPTYGTEGAACFDLYSTDYAYLEKRYPAESVGTGISVEVPNGHVMLVFSRSGHGFNHDVRLANCVGVIDSDYRGEIKVKLTLDGEESVSVSPKDRIAQALILPVKQVVFEEVQELSTTERGVAGFGSTGF